MPSSVPQDEPGLRLTARVFGAGFGFLLVWTLGVHLATFLALPFERLYLVGAAALVGALCGALFPALSVFGDRGIALPEPYPAGGAASGGWLLSAVLVLFFLLTAGVQYKLSLFTPFWIACVLIAALALWVSAKGYLPEQFVMLPVAPARGPIGLTFVVCALALMAFYFLTAIPDADDTLFLNFATGARTLRGALFTQDTMLGLPGLSFIKSTYRLESIQLLAALISDLSGWPVLVAAHTAIPALICIWAASALTLVHALLFPRLLALTLGFHLLVLIALDGALQSYGYHGVARFFQGKGPFVTVLVPLIWTLSLLAMRQRGWLAVHLLAGLVVISVGMTANAVYAAPLTAALVALVHLFLGGKTRWRSFRLLEIVVYPAVLIAILLRVDPPGGSEFASPGTIGNALWSIVGSPPNMLLGLALMFGVACMPFWVPALRGATAYVLGLLVFVVNPFLWPAYGALTGNLNYRLFWAVPVPLIFAIVLGLVWSMRRGSLRLAVLVVLVLGVVGPGSLLHKTSFGFAPLKVPPTYGIARRIVAETPPGGLVLAPEEVSAWVPVIEGAPAVVEGRALYIPQRHDAMRQDLLDRRGDLYLFWVSKEGRGRDPATVLPLFGALGVNAVLIDDTRPHHGALIDSLRAAGFREAWHQGPYLFLVQP